MKKELTYFMRNRVSRLKEEQRDGTAHVCQSTLNRVLNYTQGKEVRFDEFTAAWLVGFQNHLVADNLKDNTISTYMRSLRSIYNQAVEQELVPFIPFLFKHVHTKIDRGDSRALTERYLQQLAQPRQELPSQEERVRALFVLLYLLRGLSFSDLVHMRRCDLNGNTLRLHRHKTGSPLVITVEAPAMEILLRYANPDSRSVYLFPFITQLGQDEYRQYQTALRNFNFRLKIVAQLLGVEQRLSSHCARHSWVTIANYHHFDKKMISNGVGHSSLKMTETYFKDFEEEQLSKMNQEMISYIFQ